MTLRQLTPSEAHILDHFVDAVWSKNQKRANALGPVAVAVFGGNFDKLKVYVSSKFAKMRAKPVEEYDDGEQIVRARPRLPFGADYDIVAEDHEVLKEYMHHAIWPRDTFHEQDISAGIGDRLEVGMKMRRRKKHE